MLFGSLTKVRGKVDAVDDKAGLNLGVVVLEKLLPEVGETAALAAAVGKLPCAVDDAAMLADAVATGVEA